MEPFGAKLTRHFAPLKSVIALFLGFAAGFVELRAAAQTQEVQTAAVETLSSASDASGAELATGPKTYRSRHVLLHTDVGDEPASELLKRLEATLGYASRYWRRPAKGMLECYVAKHVDAWPADALPHPLARLAISRIGGVTTTLPGLNRAKGSARPICYARAEDGIPEHEIVHAYCLASFGRCGPTWYKEGMAELARLGGDRRPDVRCPAEYIEFFRTQPPRTIASIVHQGETTAGISRSLREVASQLEQADQSQDALVHWTESHAEEVTKALDAYRWNWALCHFLAHNENYAREFRRLGRALLEGREANFDATYADVQQQMEFEFRQFVQHVDVGLRADLCRWDWGTPCQKLRGSEECEKRILAHRGYQASGVALQAGARYAYRCRNAACAPRSQIGPKEQTTLGEYPLEAAILSDRQLGEPFILQRRGTFVANSTGPMYVRLHGKWTDIGDVRGAIHLVVGAAKLEDAELIAREKPAESIETPSVTTH
ncbi:MAG: hypothetical protein KDA61_05725 [Planctomycetales bacterium]|nr:hypothetical protein [Planctomycetales bacterium]